METEVKLVIDPEDLPSVLQHIESTAAVQSGPVTKHQVSRYFDTDDLRLFRRQIALRVRDTGSGFVQTVKTAADAGEGLLARGEWETPVSSFEPDLGALEMPLADHSPDQLSNLFTTHIDRQKLVVAFPPFRPDSTRIEIALDRGHVEASGRTSDVCEIELELLEGRASDMFELGRLLSESVPLRFSVDTKSARGYRLATGDAPVAEKAGNLEFPPDVTVEDGMRAAFRACVRQWFANQTAAYDGRDIEGVHQMRVALRRLRSAFVFFADFIADPPSTHFNEESKWVANSLGPARDWDVFIAETLAPILNQSPRHAGLLALVEAARAGRHKGYEASRIAMISPRYTAFVLHFCGWVERDGWREGASDKLRKRVKAPLTQHAGPLLEKRYRHVRSLGQDFANLTFTQKHELRISIKKLRYAGDFYRSLYPGDDTRPFRSAVMAMLKGLGRLNDLTVATRLCDELVGGADSTDAALLEEGTKAVLGWYGALADTASDDLADAWRAFRKAKTYWPETR